MAEKKSSVHVITDSNGGWSVRKSGAAKATKAFETQKEAVSFARSDAKKGGRELFIHGRDGSIQQRSSYSDANPTRSKK
jgi:hypothetical protein